MLAEIKDIIETGVDYESMYYDITDLIQDKEIHEGFDALSQGEKAVFLLEMFIFEVNNGGFDQYLVEQDGIHTLECIELLKKVGLIELSDLLKKAADVNDSGIQEIEMIDKLNHLSDEFYNVVDYDDFYLSVVTYVKNHFDLFS